MTEAPTPHDVASAWRPQRPGSRAARDIPNAIVEPHWGGVTVVAALVPDEATLYREGDTLRVPDHLTRALVDGFIALQAVVEGQVTTLAFNTGEGASPRQPRVERPPMLIPGWLRRRDLRAEDAAIRRRAELAEQEERSTIEALARGERHAFVATDLLLLDGQSLHDIPLLERKRLLESVLRPSELLRVSAFIRPSSSDVLASWAMLGFTQLSYRGSNSRYLPGEENPDWVIDGISQRGQAGV